MHYIGIDLGGTNIKAGVVNNAGEVLADAIVETNPYRQQEEVFDDINQLIAAVTDEVDLSTSEVSGIGIGAPSGVNPSTGEVIFAHNLGWKNVPLKSIMEEITGLPVTVDNDAVCALTAEIAYGNAQSAQNVVLLTLGTGVGSAVLIDGKILRGSRNLACELGHMIVEPWGERCTCGARGCLESYVSATALVKAGRRVLLNTPMSMITVESNGKPAGVTAELVLQAAINGDGHGSEIFRSYIRHLGDALSSITNIFDPELILLGGGVANAGRFLIDKAKEQMKRQVLYRDLELPQLKCTALRDNAGIVGAAVRARQEQDGK